MEIAGTDPKNLSVFAIFGLQSGIAAVAAQEIAGTDPKNLSVFAIFGLQSGIAAVAAQSDPKRHLSREKRNHQ